MKQSFQRTAEAVDAWDEAADGNATRTELRELSKDIAHAFWLDTKEYNHEETIKGLFTGAPPPFIRAMVALWKYPKQVERLKELTKKLDAYSGLTHYWYDVNVTWARNTGALTPEEGLEYARLVRWVGLAVGQNILA